MKVIALDHCAACGKQFAPGEDVNRYRVSRAPGEWADEAMHRACETGEFTSGPVFGEKQRTRH